jgi:hypothetical protein
MLMDQNIQSYINQIEIREIQHFSNMSVFPLFPPEIDEPQYRILREAISDQTLTVTEVSDSGSVPNLVVYNQSQNLVFILDGEELLGAKQNRVVNTSILFAPNSQTIIPVSCTEQGRWHYTSQHFSPSEKVLNPRARASKSHSVTGSLRMNRGYMSDQAQVWADIRSLQNESQVHSRTGAMRDVYSARSSDLGEYKSAFPAVPEQSGSLVFINGRAVGFDVLSRSDAYRKLHSSIIESYALDAMLQKKNGQPVPELEKAQEFLVKAMETDVSEHPAVGVGQDLRFSGENIVGSSLIYQNTIVHMAFFRLEGKEECTRVTRVSRRRDYRDQSY